MRIRRLAILAATLGLLALGSTSAQAAYPGTNGNLLFSRCGEGTCDSSHLYTVGADGTDPFEFISESTFDDDSSYSADGARVAFQRCDVSCGIAVANADGTGVQQLTPDDDSSVLDDWPSFSPGGSKILFGRRTSTPADEGIWVMGSDGSDAHLLVPVSTNSAREAEFSPDGSKIAFIDASNALAIVNADGIGTPHVIDTPPSGQDENPDWSPDGSRIAFTRSNVGQSVWVIPSNGSAPAVQLMDPGSGMSEAEPAFSPDGRKIAFERYSNISTNVSQIWVANADGSDPIRVTCEDCSDYGAAWRPLHPAPPTPPVPLPAPPPFAGVKLRLARTITVPASGIVRITESCALSARGSCSGTLTLKTAGAVAAAKHKHRRVLTLGKAHFSIPAGKTRTLKLRISKTGLKVLRSRHSLSAVARVVSHDGSGASKSSSAHLTLKAVKQRKKHH